MKLIVLRPEPGATATAGRARTLGLDPVVASLFAVEPLAWDPPDPARFDALMMTSANAARHAGPWLRLYAHLPAFAVGPETAVAMVKAGLSAPAVGDGDADALLSRIRADGFGHVLHPCGEHRNSPRIGEARVTPVPVYAARAADALGPAAIDAARDGAVALLHSPRAAALFATLADAAGLDRGSVAIVAISGAAARAAGGGWRSVSAAPVPRDADMLAIARGLCQNGGQMSVDR